VGKLEEVVVVNGGYQVSWERLIGMFVCLSVAWLCSRGVGTCIPIYAGWLWPDGLTVGTGNDLPNWAFPRSDSATACG
jgi:hypothetical protein